MEHENTMPEDEYPTAENANALPDDANAFPDDANPLPDDANPMPDDANPLPVDQLTADYDTVAYEVPWSDDTHWFEQFSCKAFRKCRWCWQQIKLLRGAVKCQNCGIILHKLCQLEISQACGIPEILWDHYNEVHCTITPACPSFDIQRIDCWVYEHRLAQRELRYLKFVYKTVYLYTEIPTENTCPDEFFPLGSPNIHTNIATGVYGGMHGPNLDKCISVQFYDSKESGAPRTTLVLEFLTDWDREMFLDAYEMQAACMS